MEAHTLAGWCWSDDRPSNTRWAFGFCCEKAEETERALSKTNYDNKWRWAGQVETFAKHVLHESGNLFQKLLPGLRAGTPEGKGACAGVPQIMRTRENGVWRELVLEHVPNFSIARPLKYINWGFAL